MIQRQADEEINDGVREWSEEKDTGRKRRDQKNTGSKDRGRGWRKKIEGNKEPVASEKSGDKDRKRQDLGQTEPMLCLGGNYICMCVCMCVHANMCKWV